VGPTTTVAKRELLARPEVVEQHSVSPSNHSCASASARSCSTLGIARLRSQAGSGSNRVRIKPSELRACDVFLIKPLQPSGRILDFGAFGEFFVFDPVVRSEPNSVRLGEGALDVAGC